MLCLASTAIWQKLFELEKWTTNIYITLDSLVQRYLKTLDILAADNSERVTHGKC
jgi:hypothetical protein